MFKNKKGFSLIELLIVIAIILIIAAIAIPNLLKSRMTANAASAVGSLRTINTASVEYASTFPATGFPPTLLALGSGASTPCAPAQVSILSAACMIDSVLASATKSGYVFQFTGDGNTPSVGYAVSATPVGCGTSGQISYYTDQSGVIRYASSTACAAATSASQALQ